MTANEILKLVDAGFTREDILKLDADVKVVPTETEAKAEPAPAADQPKAEVKEPTATEQPSGVTLSDDQFKLLLQQLNVQGASLDVPPEADIKTKLADHFKEITIGK